MCRRPRLGGSLDRGWAERLEQAKMYSELSLLRKDAVWRTPNVLPPSTSAHVWLPPNLDCGSTIQQWRKRVSEDYNLLLVHGTVITDATDCTYIWEEREDAKSGNKKNIQFKKNQYLQMPWFDLKFIDYL